jgi:YVTN family beta-propeller protein
MITIYESGCLAVSYRKQILLFDTTNHINLLDTTTNTILTSISATATPTDAGIAPYDFCLYGVIGRNVLVYQGANFNTIATIPLPATGMRMVFSPNQPYAYVMLNNNSLGVINTISKSLSGTIPNITSGVYDMDITPDGQYIYITNGGNPGIVTVVSTTTNTVSGTISIGTTYPYSVRCTPDNKYAYVVSTNNNLVGGETTIINISNNSIAKHYTSSMHYSFNVIMDPNNKNIYVGNSNNFVVFNSVTQAVTNTITTPECPVGSYDVTGRYVYAGQYNTGNLYVIDTHIPAVSGILSVSSGISNFARSSNF